MAVLDMNLDGTPDYDPVTQDLFIYPDGGTGDPIRWNENCIAYRFREQLETRKAKARAFTTATGLYPAPPNLPANQRANYFNNRAPPALWFTENRGIWCDHYYSALPTRNPNLPLPVSGTDHITQYLDLNNNIQLLNRLEILHPYNIHFDYALTEYSGTLLQNKKFPKIGNIFEFADGSFEEFLYIDSQDKVIIEPKENVQFLFGTGFVVNDPRIKHVYLHDSGSQFFGIHNNDLYFLGHVLSGNFNGVDFPLMARFSFFTTWNVNDPNSFFSQLNFNQIQIAKSKFPPTKNFAKQETMNEFVFNINEISKNFT